ncbi:hypothetical protein RRG08_052169 [Elysia crispata]|uniref:Uncharacterized protein n=1 Tax=Elysia crispata TaxID=231223 RepID=A0AAE1E2Z2_9GAST|nr:hypothetical protein RRG08_052169 [Elysia crispata]
MEHVTWKDRPLQQPHPRQHRLLPSLLQDSGQGSHGHKDSSITLQWSFMILAKWTVILRIQAKQELASWTKMDRIACYPYSSERTGPDIHRPVAYEAHTNSIMINGSVAGWQ